MQTEDKKTKYRKMVTVFIFAACSLSVILLSMTDANISFLSDASQETQPEQVLNLEFYQHGANSDNILPMGEIFDLHLKWTPSQKNIRLVHFDAIMPEHDHGMTVVPKINQIKSAKNEVVIEGVKLHMPGHWQLIFRFSDDENQWEQKVNIEL